MSYPSGSMTLPKPAVKKQQQTSQHHDTKVKFSDDKVTSSHDTKVTFSDSKVTFKGLPSEEKVAFRNNNNNNLLPTTAITTTEVVKKITPTDNNISQQVKFGDNVKVVTTSTSTYDSKVTFKGLSPAVVVSEDKVTFSRGHSEVKKPTPPTTSTTTPAQDASQITKPHESGESDPGYESDSSKSKPHHEQAAVEQQNSEQQQQQQHQKACTLPRRSAKVSVQPSSSTLDRRKLKSLADSEAGVTVEIISPIRVRY